MENPKNRKWRVVRSEYLARKPWFTVRHETISLPDGRTIPDYYVFEYPDWVNVTAIDREGRFVIIDQYRHGLGETSYEIPAGVAEPSDETMLAAAQRAAARQSGSRVGFVVDILQLLVDQLGIDLGGRNVRVSQHLLDGVEIRAVFQQMGGKGVAQGVRGDFCLNSSLLLIVLDDLPKALAAHAVSAHVDEEGCLAGGLHQLGAHPVQIFAQSPHRRLI